MKLFGRRKSDNYRTGYAEVIPSAPVHGAGSRHDDGMTAFPAYVEPSFDETGLSDIYEGMTFEQLVAENRALRRELSALKSRISYVKTVLLSDAAVAGADLPPVARTMPSAATADDDLQRMLAELKNDIATMNARTAAAPVRQPQDDVRAMLAELKNDIASMKAAPVVPPAPAPAAPRDDLRAMLAELKGDIEQLKQTAPVMPVATNRPMAAATDGGNEVRAMLEELKRDIATIRQEVHPPQPAAPTAPSASNPNFEIARMLSDLKADIAALRTETNIRKPEEPKVADRESSSPTGSEADSQGVRDLLAGLEKDLKAAVHNEDEGQDTGAADRLGALFSQLQKELTKVAGPVKAAEAVEAGTAGKVPEAKDEGAAPSPPSSDPEGAARTGSALH